MRSWTAACRRRRERACEIWDGRDWPGGPPFRGGFGMAVVGGGELVGGSGLGWVQMLMPEVVQT